MASNLAISGVLSSVLAICMNDAKTPRSDVYANSWPAIDQAIKQFEKDVKAETIKLRFDAEDMAHFTKTQAQWNAEHQDEDGDVIPRPNYDPPGVFPNDTAVQNVWHNNNNQFGSFSQIPNSMAQKMRAAMGPALYNQYLSSTEFNTDDDFEYANIKAFLRDKFHVKMRPQLLKEGSKLVQAKMGSTDDIYKHNLKFDAAVRAYDVLRGEQQSNADQCLTYRSTLSGNQLALSVLANVYDGGIYRDTNNLDYTDIARHTVVSMQKCLQVQMTTRTQVSAPFAATVDASSQDAIIAAVTAKVTASVVKAMSQHFPAHIAGSGKISGGGGRQGANGPRGIPPVMVPLKNGTVYCQWCGYYVPGKIYTYKKHPNAHTGSHCPNLSDPAWVATTKPTAQQKSATSHCDCNGMWTGHQAAQA